MIIIAMFATVILYLVWMRQYADETKRIPPFNISKGKEARLIGAPIILAIFGTLALQIFTEKNNSNDLKLTIGIIVASMLYAAVIIYRKAKR
jgi:dipeptide/tripeptide permease